MKMFYVMYTCFKKLITICIDVFFAIFFCVLKQAQATCNHWLLCFLLCLEGMMRHIAVEWGPDGVRVNCVSPGAVKDTEGFRRLG